MLQMLIIEEFFPSNFGVEQDENLQWLKDNAQKFECFFDDFFTSYTHFIICSFNKENLYAILQSFKEKVGVLKYRIVSGLCLHFVDKELSPWLESLIEEYGCKIMCKHGSSYNTNYKISSNDKSKLELINSLYEKKISEKKELYANIKHLEKCLEL